MYATRRALKPALGRVVLTFALALGLSSAVSVGAAPRADAAISSAAGIKVVQIAASYKGTPYRAGGTSPRGFDCSGYSRWVYDRIGKSLPRTSAAQYRATQRISKSQRRVGDLVFFGSGSRVYHMGIYAGGGKIWHSPKAGDRVKLATIWTSRVTYGRVR